MLSIYLNLRKLGKQLYTSLTLEISIYPYRVNMVHEKVGKLKLYSTSDKIKYVLYCLELTMLDVLYFATFKMSLFPFAEKSEVTRHHG